MAVKFDTVSVTASAVRMRHVVIILTSTFIQGHADLDRENNNYVQ